uniref:sunset domain-containing protein n=1 Tax=Vaginimicrobium propionicum TaxID=1871034 RepID=UPI0009704A2F|nr:hypothetical protein [Vaginimicrobium propionicum]
MPCCRKKKAQAAAKKAAARAQDALNQAHDSFDDAFSDVSDYVRPRAERAFSAAEQASQDALKSAKKARKEAVRAYEHKVVPAVNDVISKVQPAVETAYDNVSDAFYHEVMPRLAHAWEQAQENPTVQEASNRVGAAVAALKGDLSLPEPVLPAPRKKCRIFRKIFTFVGISAGVAVIALAIKALLGDKDDGWTPQAPSEPYRADDSAWGSDSVDDESSEPAESKSDDEDEKSEYGEGAYVGDNPPEGFIFKGNERSMKYHVPGTGGYERTNADVWFNSEEAAEAAGFTKAQR